jgi:hypothetical protein
MSFLLQGIVAGRSPHNRDLRGFEFKRLFCSGTFYQFAFNRQGRRNSEFADFFKIGECIVKNDLQIFEARTVIEFDKAKGFGVANGANSPIDGEGFGEVGLGSFEDVGNGGGWHLVEKKE